MDLIHQQICEQIFMKVSCMESENILQISCISVILPNLTCQAQWVGLNLIKGDASLPGGYGTEHIFVICWVQLRTIQYKIDVYILQRIKYIS